jgi:hypothetical protein
MKNLIFLAFLISLPSIGQTIGNGDGITTDTQAGIVFRDVPIEGSPYMNEIYKKGETIINGESQSSALMRYDAYNDAVEILDKSRQPRKLLRRPNITAVFDGKTYKVVSYLEDGQTKMGYFNPLNEGETVLYFKPKKQFVQAEKPDHGYDNYDPPTYRNVSSYYLKKGDAPAKIVKLKKRQFLKQLDTKASILKEFIRKHDLDMGKEGDAIRLVNFYNTLHDTSEKQTYGGPIGVGS